jgi:hypothetical protein
MIPLADVLHHAWKLLKVELRWDLVQGPGRRAAALA